MSLFLFIYFLTFILILFIFINLVFHLEFFVLALL